MGPPSPATTTMTLKAKAERCGKSTLLETGCVSWSEVLRKHALDFGSKLAYVTLDSLGAAGQGLTYSGLRSSARRIGSVLTHQLPQQSRILILLPQDLSFIKAYLSCLITGMVAVPVYLPNNGKHISKVQGIFADAQPQAILWSESSTPKLWSHLKECSACEGAVWIDIDVAESGPESAEPDVSPDQLAMLQYTSGSTGAPKGVMLTHRNLLANQEMMQGTFGLTSDSRVLGGLPLYHDMGLIGNILQPLYAGAACFFLSPREIVRQPLSWLRSISRHRATVSGGPNAYYDLCIDRIDASAGLDDLDLSCWKVAYNGAEPIRSSTIERFARKFARHGFQKSAFLPVYGLAEASLLVTGTRKALLPAIMRLNRTEYERGRVIQQNEQDEQGGRPATTIVGCGLPAPGVEIAIFGSDGRYLDEREIGEILVRSDSVTQGYWNSPSDNLFEVRRVAGCNEAQFLRTGDMGFVFKGELFVTGRAKECIIIRGRNYYPADIESTATQACGLPAGCRNAAFSVLIEEHEEIVVVQEICRDRAIDHEAIRQAISRQTWMEHEIHLYDIVLARPGTIPRTTSGKTRRLLIKQLYASGQLPALDAEEHERGKAQRRPHELDGGAGDAIPGVVDQQDIQACLIETFRGYFPGQRDQIHGDTPMSALGLDSYTLVSISDQIGRQLAVEVPLMELLKRNTIAELASHIAEHLVSFSVQREASPRCDSGRAAPKIRQTHGQIALWNQAKTTSSPSALTVSRAVRVSQHIDAQIFDAAVTRLMSQHEILRTELREENGDYFQVIETDRQPGVVHVDASNWDETCVNQYLEEKANAILDVANGELWRWYLLDRPHGSILLFTFHHTICDLETVNILLEALFATGVTDATSGDKTASYADYVERQYEFLGSDAGHRSRLVWSQRLENADLKVDIVSRKGKLSRAGAGFRERVLGSSSTDALLRKSSEANVGLNVLLLAVFAATLKRYTLQARYAIGVPISARTHGMFRSTLGYMVNVLPVVVDFSSPRHFADLVQLVRERMLLALENQEYPLSLIIQEYRREHPELAHELDLPNVVFVYQKASLSDGQDATAFAMNMESDRPATLGGLELFSLPVRAREAEFPLVMTAGVIDGSLAIHLQWDDGMMYESVMSSMFEDYIGWLKNVMEAHDLAELGCAIE